MRESLRNTISEVQIGYIYNLFSKLKSKLFVMFETVLVAECKVGSFSGDRQATIFREGRVHVPSPVSLVRDNHAILESPITQILHKEE